MFCNLPPQHPILDIFSRQPTEDRLADPGVAGADQTLSPGPLMPRATRLHILPVVLCGCLKEALAEKQGCLGGVSEDLLCDALRTKTT